MKKLAMIGVLLLSGCATPNVTSPYPTPCACIWMELPCWMVGHNWTGNSPSEIQITDKHEYCTRCGRYR